MKYQKSSKEEFKKLERTKLGGSDGDLYLEPYHKEILKLFYRFTHYQMIDDKLAVLEQLIELSELKQVAALPKKLVNVPAFGRSGFWMHYYKAGIKLDDWTRQNKKHPEKILEMYKRISVILRRLHLEYGIIVSDCYYNNILIIDDEYPIFVDVDSWGIEGIESYTVSRILYDYAKRMRFNRYHQWMYLRHSKDADNAALWLMYLELGLNLPVRKKAIAKFPEIVKREGASPIIQEITRLISNPELPEVPYLHEVAQQYTLHK